MLLAALVNWFQGRIPLATHTWNSLGSCLLQAVLIKLVKLHVQYGKLSMRLVEENVLKGCSENDVYVVLSVFCIYT